MMMSGAPFLGNDVTTGEHETSDNSEDDSKEPSRSGRLGLEHDYDERARKKRQRTAESSSSSPSCLLVADNEPTSEERTMERIADAEHSGDLDQDYSVIAQLMKDLDTQVGRFATNMNSMVDSVPAHVGLAALWENMAQPTTPKRSHRSTEQGHEAFEDTKQQELVEQLILGDEAEDPDDPLVFI
jgi:hypothetical protein